MRRSLWVGLALLSLSASCTNQPVLADPPRVLGLVEFTFEDNGSQIQTRSRWLTPNIGLMATSLTASNLPVIAPSGSSTTSDLAGRRYLAASFNLQNPSAGANYSNLTFHAVTVDSSIPGGASLGGTALRNLKDSNAVSITDPAVARGIRPTHKLVNLSGALQVDSSGADFQVFDATTQVQPVQTAINALPALNGHVTALGYGFVARRAINNPARTVGAGETGFVTLGLHYPITPASTPRRMSLTYVVVNETVTQVTEASEEQGPSSGAVARAAALGAGTVINVLPASSLTAGVRTVCPVTWAASSGGLPALTAACQTPPVPTDALFIAPDGNDTTGSGSASAPWKSFGKAFSALRSGGVLILKNGVYRESLGTSALQPPSGSAGNLTVIRAETDGGVVIDTQAQSIPLSISNSYIRIEGMKFLNGSQSVGNLSGDNVQVVRSAFGNAGAGLYDDIVDVSGNGVLIEDSWMWGRGKVGILVGTGDTNDLNNVSRGITLRRVVIRLDSYTGTLGYVGVVMYGAADTTIENVITLDFNTAPTNFDWKGGFRSRDMQGGAGKSQRYFGTIALNLPYDGYRMSDSSYENVIAWKVGGRGGLYEDSYQTGYQIKNATVGVSSQGGIQTNTTSVSNSLLYAVSGGNVGGNYNHFFNTPLPAGATNALTSDPRLKYITRIETGSPANGTGLGGANRGATVTQRYQDGVLTTQPLWPWPNEQRIKQDFQTDFGLSGGSPKRGFAADGVGLRGSPITLTSYIWEFLGNPCPTEICP